MVNRTYKLKIILAALLLTLISVGNTYAANITAYLDRNPVNLDESFQLVLEADGSVDDDPDFRGLEKDFDIINTSQSTNMSFVNGTMSQKRVWTLTLISKQAGILTIPSISFGKDKSPSLRVTIKNASSQNNNSGSTRSSNPGTPVEDIFLEVEVDQKSTWVQSQIVYTIRLFHRVNLNNPTLSRLETSDRDAIIERLGDTKSYEASRNGVRYSVSELNFAVYPQHSGKLTFKPMLLEGRVSTSRSQSLFDQFMSAGKIKRVRSKSLSVNINPRPDNVQLKNWLPAKKVTLEEDWSENIQQLKTGEPVTRTITLTADGQMAAYLPDLKLPEIDGFKQYPDKPVQDNNPSEKGITGTRQIKIAMIPTRAGNYRMPGITIPWWNTRTGKKEITRLPEVLLKVSGAIDSNNNPPLDTSIQIPQQTNTSSDNLTVTPQSRTDNLFDISASYWPWISLVLATGWLITLVAYFRKRHKPATTAKGGLKTRALPIKPLEQAVIKQCENNNARQTKDALLAWARVRWPDKNVSSLADIAQLSPALKEAIMSLNTALYSASSAHWTGTQLAEAFKIVKKQAVGKSPSGKSVLEPLYKT